ALCAQGYFALAADARVAGYRDMNDYYAFTGPFAEKIAEGLLTTPQAIAQLLRGYEEAGCDELVLFPTVPDIAQLEQLAEVLYGLGRGYKADERDEEADRKGSERDEEADRRVPTRDICTFGRQ